jgi:5-deoxy-5-amino-3-dehydroquinate synthase
VRQIEVLVEPRPYDVLIGPGVRAALPVEIARVVPDAKVAAIVTQAPLVDAGWLDSIDTGLSQHVILVGEGEDEKSLATIERLCRRFVELGLSRHDVVVAVGGGMVSDVAGFAAATYHRGISYFTVATTLLAQVDAAIGGKTGVNLPEGKNLVGAFWQPGAVLCDTELLATLPPSEWACGRGEMAKYAFLGAGTPSAALLDLELPEQVATCVQIKADVVRADEREGGRRMILNYGHTLGHALEAEGLERRGRGIVDRVGDLKHGEAVAIGVVFAAELAFALGRIDAARVALHRSVVTGFDLPSDLPDDVSAEALVAAMGRDKKAHHDLTFVLDGDGGVEAVSGIDPAVVLATLRGMGARP